MFELILVIIAARGIFFHTKHENEPVFNKEDKYLPKMKRKKIKLLWFSNNYQLVRWRVYWTERITQILVYAYIAVLFLGGIITSSFDFIETTGFRNFSKFNVMILFFLPAIMVIGVSGYTLIRSFFDKSE